MECVKLDYELQTSAEIEMMLFLRPKWMVPGAGLEPARAKALQILSLIKHAQKAPRIPCNIPFRCSIYI